MYKKFTEVNQSLKFCPLGSFVPFWLYIYHSASQTQHGKNERGCGDNARIDNYIIRCKNHGSFHVRFRTL